MKYTADIAWELGSGEDFAKGQYSRGHEWQFDGGVTVPASSSPDIVPIPFSVAANVDPEEAFVASLSSCHMLWFLHLAQEAGLVCEAYADEAEGVMANNAEGKLAMTEVTLRPQVKFADGGAPVEAQLHALHHAAHEVCFIANSVKTEIKVEPII